jgi:pilus assembly protein CpaB
MSSISLRTITTVVAALLFGLVAVVLTRAYLNGAVRTNPAVATSNGPAIPVVVAAANVPRGATMQASMLKLVAYPTDAAPIGIFHTIAEVVGAPGQERLALRSMVINEPVLPGNVTGPGGKLNLSAVVTPGMRAVSLRSNDVVGVGGFVLPGDRVDILLTRNTGNGTGANTVTQVLAENVRVLGVDQSANDEADKPVVAKAVTIEVSPSQAQAISLGEQIGTVSMSLRRVADDGQLTVKAMTVADLGPAPRRTPAAAAPAIRVIRGVNTTRFSLGVGQALQQMGSQAQTAVAAP